MDRIGALKPEKRLAADGLWEIWLARDLDLAAPRLVVRHTDSTDPAAEPAELQRLRFLDAARALARIEHRNVARILDFRREADGVPVWVMPGYRRRLTERLAQDSAPDREEAQRLLDGVSAGLAAAHAENVFHGALGPESVLLAGAEATPKLYGFYGGVGRSDSGRPAAVADVFQLGLLAYRLFAGKSPAANAPRPSALAPGLPPSLEEWIMSCLARDPAKRPQTGAAALDAFRDACQAA